MNMTPVVMEQSYTARDSCLYALSVGCGIDLADDWARQHLGPLPPARTLPAMATVLAAPRLHAMDLGITLSGVLHGRQGMIAHAVLPVEGQVTSVTRVDSVFDRGEGRGCEINMIRDIHDTRSKLAYASVFMTFICRSDRVAGAPALARSVTAAEDDRPPDHVVQIPTSTQSAQLFALTGDQNPLHMVPSVAAKAGFPSPILHGVATYGLCAAFAEKVLCGGGDAAPGGRLGAISGKFNAPVFPGETIELALWREPTGARIEARAVARQKIVFADGRVAIEGGR
ncbi:MaoC/PaaZ C-terminal domain-containing protein [Sphingomonas panacis]|nr:MaoC/PaaZ C-terminal domain-containing protein [Sphingomonas panacis]